MKSGAVLFWVGVVVLAWTGFLWVLFHVAQGATPEAGGWTKFQDRFSTVRWAGAPLVLVTSILVLIVTIKRPNAKGEAYTFGTVALAIAAMLPLTPFVDTRHREPLLVGDVELSVPWRYLPPFGRSADQRGNPVTVSVYGRGFEPDPTGHRYRQDGRLEITISPNARFEERHVQDLTCDMIFKTYYPRFECRWKHDDLYVRTSDVASCDIERRPGGYQWLCRWRREDLYELNRTATTCGVIADGVDSDLACIWRTDEAIYLAEGRPEMTPAVEAAFKRAIEDLIDDLRVETGP